MELLIPGLILVALMVYASTKIKKNAARAFEPEHIETDEFSITKPDGFLNPLNDESGLAFIAYSKEFGKDNADNIRQASAELRVFEDANFEDICGRTKEAVTRIVSEDVAKIGEAKSCAIEAELDENGIGMITFYKITAKNGKVFQLNVSVLPEYKNDYAGRIEEMLESFTAK